jgi:hypothetical protein
LHRAERTIAERLMQIANGKLPWPWIDPDKALPWVEERIGLALAERRGSLLKMNQEIACQPEWNEAAIKRRAVLLSQLAISLWPPASKTQAAADCAR